MSNYTRCPVCGKTYRVFYFVCADQSKCPECRSAEEIAARRSSTEEQKARRRKAYGDAS